MSRFPPIEPPVDPLELTVPTTLAGLRLDKALGQSFALSRARFQALIDQGCVSVNGTPVKQARYTINTGDEITVILPAAEPAQPQPQDIPLDIVHEDDDVIVINKPAGLVVHPAPGNREGTLVNALISHCGSSLSGIGGIKRPGIVHRLDKDTSGLIIAAKNDRAHQGLARQFHAHGRDGRLQRAYLALVWGIPSPPTGRIDLALARSSSNRQKMAITDKHGKAAITHYSTQRKFKDDQDRPLASLIECRLETGRTHQIRVHMSHLRHPLIGDALYGSGFKTSETRLPPAARDWLALHCRQMLHAYKLGFEHPVSGDNLIFETSLPEDMQGLINAILAPD